MGEMQVPADAYYGVSTQHDLIPALQGLQQALQEKADAFMPIVKTGRTHLQDATPIRLGQEFLGYAGQIERGIARMRHAQGELSEVALGQLALRVAHARDTALDL